VLRFVALRDNTKAFSEHRAEPIARFLHEEEIGASQITRYKIGVHKRFLREWMADKGCLAGFSLYEVGRFERNASRD